MSLIVKLIISLVIAVIAFVLTSIMLTGEVMLTGDPIDLRLLIAFFVATAFKFCAQRCSLSTIFSVCP